MSPVPADPDAFVAEVERVSNAYDGASTRDLYAEDATLVSISDGARDVTRGRDAIVRNWELSFAAARLAGLRVSKRLEAADDTTIVNTWEGRMGRRVEAAGVEVWRFDDDGKVVEHLNQGAYNVNPIASPLQSLRVLVTSPRLAVAFLRARAGR